MDKERFSEYWFNIAPTVYYIVDLGGGHIECGKVVNNKIILFAKMFKDGKTTILPGPPIDPGWVKMDVFDWKSYYYSGFNVQEISEAKFNCLLNLL